MYAAHFAHGHCADEGSMAPIEITNPLHIFPARFLLLLAVFF
jgi:hypothetical protein